MKELMRNKNIRIILPPALRGPGMLKSPPLDIANLVAILKLNVGNNVSLTDFRKHVVNSSSYYQARGVNLSIFNDFKKCLRHFLTEDFEISQNVSRILSETSFEGVEYIVFSVMVLEQFSLPHLLSSLCLAKQIKKEFPHIKIIFFGNCPDLHIAKIIKLFKLIDAFPIGGNELYVADYIHGRKEGVVEGVYYRKKGKVFSPKGFRGVDLDRFPLPDFSLFDLEDYKANGHLILPYELSREFVNSYYYSYYIRKGKINTKDPAKAAAELMMLSRQYKTSLFHLMDVAINLDPDWLMKFCYLLVQQKEKIKWCALALPNIQESLLDKLKEAGCVQLRWGVESGSERMLKNIDQGTTKESIKNTLVHAHSIGINNYITLVSGLEGELESDVEETKIFLQEIAPYVDSAKECIYGELGHFSLGVFESFMNHSVVQQSKIRYKDILRQLNIGQEDIIDFMTLQADVH